MKSASFARRGRRVAVAVSLGGLAALATASPAARADTQRSVPKATTAQVTQPVRPCASLATLDLSAVSAQVESAATSTPNGVAFCEVKGYISPQTHFTVLLPETTWRGNYLQQGCGGFCGHNDVSLTDPARTSGHQAPYAPLSSGELVVAADDQGHRDQERYGRRKTPCCGSSSGTGPSTISP